LPNRYDAGIKAKLYTKIKKHNFNQMKSYKLEEKLFLSKAIISNVHSMRLKSRFTDNSDNETLVDESIELAVLMLEKRNLLFGESVKNNQPKRILQEVDFEEIVESFNSVRNQLPEVTKITKERKNLILKILETYCFQDIKVVFKYASESDYLNGKKADWKASFDWILMPKNFIKILEGNYKNKVETSEPPKEQMFGRMTQSTVEKNYQTFLNAYPDGK